EDAVAINMHSLLRDAHKHHERTAWRELRFPPILARLELAGRFSGGRAFSMSRRLLHRLHGGEQSDGDSEDFQEFHEMPLLIELENLSEIQARFNASRTAAMNFSSLNGFMKNATGPIAIAVARAARSSRAVMTITRVLGEIAQRRASTSKPVTPSIQMSVTTTGTCCVLA